MYIYIYITNELCLFEGFLDLEIAPSSSVFCNSDPIDPIDPAGTPHSARYQGLDRCERSIKGSPGESSG